jgi:hypothetical protein
MPHITTHDDDAADDADDFAFLNKITGLVGKLAGKGKRVVFDTKIGQIGQVAAAGLSGGSTAALSGAVAGGGRVAATQALAKQGARSLVSKAGRTALKDQARTAVTDGGKQRLKDRARAMMTDMGQSGQPQQPQAQQPRAQQPQAQQPRAQQPRASGRGRGRASGRGRRRGRRPRMRWKSGAEFKKEKRKRLFLLVLGLGIVGFLVMAMLLQKQRGRIVQFFDGDDEESKKNDKRYVKHLFDEGGSSMSR